jgi:hypothetical protein
MKKRIIFLLSVLLLLVGCGKTTESSLPKPVGDSKTVICTHPDYGWEESRIVNSEVVFNGVIKPPLGYYESIHEVKDGYLISTTHLLYKSYAYFEEMGDDKEEHIEQFNSYTFDNITADHPYDEMEEYMKYVDNGEYVVEGRKFYFLPEYPEYWEIYQLPKEAIVDGKYINFDKWRELRVDNGEVCQIQP